MRNFKAGLLGTGPSASRSTPPGIKFSVTGSISKSINSTRHHQHSQMREHCTKDITLPIRIAGIPPNGLFKTLFPSGSLRPTQALQLLIIQKVPLIIVRPIFNKHDICISIHIEKLAHINNSPLPFLLDFLSTLIVTLSFLECVSLLSSLFNHNACVAAAVAAMNSDSHDDSATVACFCVLQLIGDSP
nr:hypothetical protein [Tanacetum cinerariifolium]